MIDESLKQLRDEILSGPESVSKGVPIRQLESEKAKHNVPEMMLTYLFYATHDRRPLNNHPHRQAVIDRIKNVSDGVFKAFDGSSVDPYKFLKSTIVPEINSILQIIEKHHLLADLNVRLPETTDFPRVAKTKAIPTPLILINDSAREVIIKGAKIEIDAERQFEVLKIMIEAKGAVVTHQSLIQILEGPTFGRVRAASNALRGVISSINKALPHRNPKLKIEPSRGRGYKLRLPNV